MTPRQRTLTIVLAIAAALGALVLAMGWYGLTCWDAHAHEESSLQQVVRYAEPWRSLGFGITTVGLTLGTALRFLAILKEELKVRVLTQWLFIYAFGLGAMVLAFTTSVYILIIGEPSGVSVRSGLIAWQAVGGVRNHEDGPCLGGVKGTEHYLTIEGKVLVVPWLPLPRTARTLDSIRAHACPE